MKLELSIIERIVLMGILPKEGNFKTMRQLRVLREEIGFSDEETARIKLREENGLVRWDPKETADKMVEMGLNMREALNGILVKLDKEGKLLENMVTLYEKIVGVDPD